MTDHAFKGRREDFRLVTGAGRYTADHHMEGQARGHFLRADRAHARIVSIDTEAALAQEGVIGILTGQDLMAAGLKSPQAMAFFKGVDGSTLRVPFRPALATDRVRFVGEPVALIVAETVNIAQDAAEMIAVEYEELPVAIGVPEALAADATPLHEEFPDNLAFAYEYGDRAATDSAFAKAAHVVKVSVTAQRIAGNPMEPKSCVAGYDAAEDIFDVCIPTQGTADQQTTFAHVLGVDRAKVRIKSMDVGGAFGVRNEVYPEFIAVAWAAKQFGRPVKWTGTRGETLSGDHHARDAILNGELALDAKGQFLAVRTHWLINHGAYCSQAGAMINTIAAPTSSATSLYSVPAVFGRHDLAFTNTTPTTAYRGAARPNVSYLWERLVEEAARAIGIDSIKLRRRNALKKSQFPFKTPTGATYDSGDPIALLDGALQESEWDSFEARRKAAKKRGKLRGIGCALFIEPSGGAGQEEIRIEFTPEGRMLLRSNVGPSGQGHETVFPDIVADILGLPSETIDLSYNDHTNSTPRMAGTGSFGSRSLMSHGGAFATGAKEVIRKARELAADELEVDPQDLNFENGTFQVSGTDLKMDLKAIIRKFASAPDRPLDTGAKLDTVTAFPSGAHIAEVEIDPDTGIVEILSYIAVDDCGTVYNHALVEGQLHGGLMQGIGQVMGEHIAYDSDTGQLLSGSFMDYFMPRATELPKITLVDKPVPSPANPLGAKGAGEAGATGSVPALANAVINALKPLNIHHVEMPFTPSRIWNAIHDRAE